MADNDNLRFTKMTRNKGSGPARCYLALDGTRASRKPMLWAAAAGGNPWLSDARQNRPGPSQLPPRITQLGPPSNKSGHRCPTLPCISSSPSWFGLYEPTFVVRSRYGPFSALPQGLLPSKLACLEERSLVGLSK